MKKNKEVKRLNLAKMNIAKLTRNEHKSILGGTLGGGCGTRTDPGQPGCPPPDDDDTDWP